MASSSRANGTLVGNVFYPDAFAERFTEIATEEYETIEPAVKKLLNKARKIKKDHLDQ